MLILMEIGSGTRALVCRGSVRSQNIDDVTNNILSPANGDPIIVPAQDVVRDYIILPGVCRRRRHGDDFFISMRHTEHMRLVLPVFTPVAKSVWS